MSDNSSANKRIARNSLFMSIRMVIVLLISLYTTRVVLEVLGVEDYGVYNVVAGFVYMFTFLNGAMSSASQRFYNVELARNGTPGARLVYCASFKIHLILGLVIVMLVEPIGLWYIHHKMVLPEGQLDAALWVFHFSVGAMFFNVIYTPYTAAVMAHEKMDFYALVEVLNAFMKLGMALALPLLSGNRLIWYGFYYLLISIIVFLLYYIYCRKKFPEIRMGADVPRSMFKEMFSFSAWGVFGSLAYSLRDQGVNLVLNAFFGTVVNAARGVTAQINGAVQGLVGSLATPSRPQVIQSYSQGNIARTWNLTYSISKISCMFFYLMALPICVEINYILHLWLGDDVPEYTQIFVILTLATNTIGTFTYPVSGVMHATGKMTFYQITSSVSNLMTVPLAYLFLILDEVPAYVYVALFITMLTTWFAGLVSAHKYAQLSYWNYFKSVVAPCLLVMVVTIPLSLLPCLVMDEGFLRLIVEGAFCVLIVSIASYYIALDTHERELVINMLGKILGKK